MAAIPNMVLFLCGFCGQTIIAPEIVEIECPVCFQETCFNTRVVVAPMMVVG